MDRDCFFSKKKIKIAQVGFYIFFHKKHDGRGQSEKILLKPNCVVKSVLLSYKK